MAQNEPAAPPAMFKLMNPIIRFLVRNNIGPMSNALMVITHTGRKSGKAYSIPIGYVRDGDTILAVTLGGRSQWYQNVQQHPEAMLTIKGKPIRARAVLVNDVDEVARVLDIYKREQAQRYERFFGVPLTMSADEAARSPQLRAKYVRFHPIA
ncbi:MAG: nitroreductase family deazaflavin-dependent oxidoreductase [Chloroflexota bacterium]|nr:nitroreductase family deazaflavin-dependent oxidoreductase [Chloroflexota bacterium]